MNKMEDAMGFCKERKEYLEQESISILRDGKQELSSITPHEITSKQGFVISSGIAQNVSQEDYAHISNFDSSMFPHDIVSKVESDDSPIDTDEIVEFHKKFVKNDENYKKAKNHNLLTRNEIKELTAFFLKQHPLKIIEKFDGIRENIDRLKFVGYLDDLKTLDTLKKYVKSKIK